MIFAPPMNAKNHRTNRSFAFSVKGHCGTCRETVFALDRKQVVQAIFREIPIPLGCGQCGSVRLATSTERSALGYFLSEQTLPIELTDVHLMSAEFESRADPLSALEIAQFKLPARLDLECNA
jgi:hypothetical protein